MVEIKVPEVGDSIQEVQINRWLIKEGEWVQKDSDIVELDTEKAAVQIAAPESGVVQKIIFPEGEFAKVGDVIGQMELSDQPAGGGSTSADDSSAAAGSDASFVMPAAQVLLDENGLKASEVTATGPGGRLLKEDVLNHLAKGKSVAAAPAAPAKPAAPAAAPVAITGDRTEEVKPMSMIRRTIASRLIEAQHTAALLTTFNEIDMQPVMELRSKYKDMFVKKHGVKLGFMSFFAKASVEALKRYPAINSEIDGTNVIYKNYIDIGIAIGGGKGLVVPCLRNVENMSFADVERQIGEYAVKANENRITPQDLQGGTFTISNGGIYGSLLSTPIVNPPQSGILGLHSIQERPIAVNGEVVIRPMMYVALTYDHRIVDGKEAVMFLRTIKEVLEEPARLFLEV